MPVAPQPDLTVALSGTLLADLTEAINITLRRGELQSKNKARLKEFLAYSALRKRDSHMTFTLSPVLLKDISDCINVATSRADMTDAAKARLGEWQVEVMMLIPPEPIQKQTRMKI